LRWLPGATITVTVPSGWYAFPGARGISQQTDTPRELGFSLWGVVGVYTDACASEGTLVEVGPSVADLVKALVDQEGSDASVPADVTFGGFPAKRIDLTVPLALEGATCRIGDGLQIGANMAETDFFALPFGFSSTVYVIDVDGQRLVITTGTGDASSVEDVAEMQAMLDSIRIEP
jgi:hypothetical protein